VGNFKDIYIDKNTFETVLYYGGKSKINIKLACHLYCKRGYLFKNKVEKLYDLKKKYPEDSEIYKIALNALYGKLLQKISNYVKKKDQKFAFAISDSHYDNENKELFFKIDKPHQLRNAIYASFITSFTRSQIYGDIYKHQDKIIAIFTDCIISEIPLDLPLSDKIGEYKQKIIKDLYIIGSGVYFYKEVNKQKLSFRGFNISNPKDIIKKLLHSKISKIRFLDKQRVSLGKALSQHNEEYYNLIYNAEKILDLNFDNKRVWERKIKQGKDLKGIITSKPLPFL
jgi:hypothetical protein